MDLCFSRSRHRVTTTELPTSKETTTTFSSVTATQMTFDANVCDMPMETGPCRASMPMYGFDTGLRTCTEFIYGGCYGNANKFITYEACMSRCDTSPDGRDARPSTPKTEPTELVPLKCSKTIDRGPCRRSVIMYGYDPEEGRCIQFVYGGCLGNGNRFKTIAECESYCLLSSENVCSLPMQRGNCRALLPMFGYDNTIGYCVQFMYGGCDGNGNRFQTIEDCLDRCTAINTEPYSEGTTQMSTEHQITIPFRSHDDIPVCEKTIDSGPCQRRFYKYGFDIETLSCVKFIFGGCLGNENNFETIAECEEMCIRETQSNIDDGQGSGEVNQSICTLEKEIGPCNNMILMFWYNTDTRQCEVFMYGGCDGNSNRFASSLECETACAQIGRSFNETSVDHIKRLPDACLELAYSGECRATVRRFFYDTSTGRCAEFVYGGCNANGNNFETEEQCQNTCRPRVSLQDADVSSSVRSRHTVCSMSPHAGGSCGRGGDNPSIKYYFRYTSNISGECKPFFYEGCGGNSNNFDSAEHCMAVCRTP